MSEAVLAKVITMKESTKRSLEIMNEVRRYNTEEKYEFLADMTQATLMSNDIKKQDKMGDFRLAIMDSYITAFYEDQYNAALDGLKKSQEKEKLIDKIIKLLLRDFAELSMLEEDKGNEREFELASLRADKRRRKIEAMVSKIESM